MSEQILYPASASAADSDRTVTRRSLLRKVSLVTAGAALSGTILLESAGPAVAGQDTPAIAGKSGERLRGVNLGGWFVLEKWLQPSVFRGLKAGDEYSVGEELGPEKAHKYFDDHRNSWITEDDFAWLQKTGINAVRIPVGYWVLDAPAPYVSGREQLDRAFEWAQKHDLKVALDLHGAPGSQNGWDHSGRSGEMGWHKNPENIAKTLDVIESFAVRYGKHPALGAIELMNEPRWDMPLDTLKQYYLDGYARVRKHCPAERVAVMFHDSFRGMNWGGFMAGPEYKNVILDTHLYQCFTDDDKKLDAPQHIRKASVEWTDYIAKIQKQLPVNVGEWSLALTPETTRGLTKVGRDATLRAYGGAQLLSFESDQRGWFFWTYKTEHIAEWSFRESVERGWLPEKYG